MQQPVSLRDRLFEELARGAQHYPCTYCRTNLRRRALTIDHVVPRARGGTNARTNVVLACWPCNGTKGDSPVEDFITWLGSLAGGKWLAGGPTRKAVDFQGRQAAKANARTAIPELSERPYPLRQSPFAALRRSPPDDAPMSDDWKTWPRGGRDGE